MCEHEPTRRQLLVGAAVGTAALMAGARPAVAAYPPPVAPVEVMPGLLIHPRAHWGGDLPPKRPTVLEDSRFLLVHHTASSNTYADPRDVMRVTYWWHTSSDPSKGWPDVCYEFFIGRDGDIYEGRAGALTHPVVADATGGNQGFAQLICLLGDFSTVAPTAAAQDSLVKVLAWLAGRDQISIADGATASFTSRGSQRWAKGASVTTPTITGHRDMSYTGCPGDRVYDMMPSIRERARAQLAAWSGVLRPAVRLGPPPS